MKLKKIDALLFQILFFALAGIVVTRVTGLNSLSSVFFAVTFPTTAVLWLRSVRNGLHVTDWIMVVAGVLAVVNVLINLFVSGGSFSLSYFKKVIMFIMTLHYLQACYKMRPGKKLGLLLHRIVTVLVVYLILMHLFFRDQMHTLNGVQTKYAAFNFSNPNLTAIFFTCMYMLEAIRTISVQQMRERIFHGVLTGAMGLLVLDTTSRNGLLVMVLFTVLALCVVFREQIRNKFRFAIPTRIRMWAAAVIAVIPAAFALVYMALINASWVQLVFGFLVSEGKKLDSRVKEWKPALEAIRKFPFTGDYYGISDGTGAGHMHNTHMDIAASYGVVVLVLVCILLTVYIYQNGKVYKKTVPFLYMAGFCCALMLGIFESVMFSGGLGTYVFLGAFLLLSGSGAREEKQSGKYEVK